MRQYLLEHSKPLVPTATEPHLGCKTSLLLELFRKIGPNLHLMCDLVSVFLSSKHCSWL